MRRDDPGGRQPAAGPDPDQPDVHGEVVVDGLPLDRFDEVHLGRPLAVQLAVEEIDHDLAREAFGRGLPRTVELEDMGTGQNQGLFFRAMNHRAGAEADGTLGQDPDADHGFPRLGILKFRLGLFLVVAFRPCILVRPASRRRGGVTVGIGFVRRRRVIAHRRWRGRGSWRGAGPWPWHRDRTGQAARRAGFPRFDRARGPANRPR